MEWDQFSYAPKINAVVHYDLINLKIDGSKKSPFQILGSNFLLPFPDRTNFLSRIGPRRHPVLLYNYNYTIPKFPSTQIVRF